MIFWIRKKGEDTGGAVLRMASFSDMLEAKSPIARRTGLSDFLYSIMGKMDRKSKAWGHLFY